MKNLQTLILLLCLLQSQNCYVQISNFDKKTTKIYKSILILGKNTGIVGRNNEVEEFQDLFKSSFQDWATHDVEYILLYDCQRVMITNINCFAVKLYRL